MEPLDLPANLGMQPTRRKRSVLTFGVVAIGLTLFCSGFWIFLFSLCF